MASHTSINRPTSLGLYDTQLCFRWLCFNAKRLDGPSSRTRTIVFSGVLQLGRKLCSLQRDHHLHLLAVSYPWIEIEESHQFACSKGRLANHLERIDLQT